jgi:hypothetical protein
MVGVAAGAGLSLGGGVVSANPTREWLTVAWIAESEGVSP